MGDENEQTERTAKRKRTQPKRSRRKKASVSTTLTSIEGIGESRGKALLKHFKTMKAISAATEAELTAVKGMNKNAAKAVFEAFHGKNNPEEE